MDQILPFHCEPTIYEGYVRDARDYVHLAVQVIEPNAWPADCCCRPQLRKKRAAASKNPPILLQANGLLPPAEQRGFAYPWGIAIQDMEVVCLTERQSLRAPFCFLPSISLLSDRVAGKGA